LWRRAAVVTLRPSSPVVPGALRARRRRVLRGTPVHGEPAGGSHSGTTNPQGLGVIWR
jgi:hypothetical protein